jgi:hypothetical protein
MVFHFLFYSFHLEGEKPTERERDR